jgi:hypothetical protein
MSCDAHNAGRVTPKDIVRLNDRIDDRVSLKTAEGSDLAGLKMFSDGRHE